MEFPTRLIDLLDRLGAPGLWMSIGLLACISVIYVAKQVQELRSTSLSVKEKQFEQLSKLVQDKDIEAKPGLLLEQAFERYFGFILGADEICHILKSKKQTEVIRDLKYCKSMFIFDNNAYVYTGRFKIKIRHIVNDINYWVSSMLVIFVTLYALLQQNYPILIYTIIFGINVYLALDSGRALYAAKRIQSKYYVPQN